MSDEKNTEQLTKDEIDAMKMRCSRATPGPWESIVEAREETVGTDFISTSGEDIYLSGATIDDQNFIAHARQDVPKLIREIERLRAELHLP